MNRPARVPVCLSTPYSSKPGQRGGTQIAEEVLDLETHRRWMGFINYYRPEQCGSCGSERLHGHGCRSRELKMGDDWVITEDVRRFQCAGCGGIWQILPAVIARYLHRTWDVVQSAAERACALTKASKGHARTLPRRTIARWLWRLALSALVVAQALAVTNVATAVEAAADTRGAFVDALTASGAVSAEHKLAHVAEWIHRVVPGVRLM